MDPDFLQTVFADNDCPDDSLLHDAFKSKEKFCELYNRESQLIRDCLTHAAAKIIVNSHKIVKYELHFGKCCPRYAHLT